MKENNDISKSKIDVFQNKIMRWFKSYGRHYLPWRKEGLSSYDIIIAEILLQRTKAETVERFYNGFLQKFPDWNTIAVADIGEIEEYLKPVGLYHQRSKRLKNLAIEMVNRNSILPEERNELEQLPFFGQYIVNAILLQIFHIPSPLMDVNMSRVLERYFGERKLADIRYDPYLQKLAYQVVHHKFPKEINWAILDFASSICRSKPICEKCFLSNNCKYYQKLIKLNG